MDDSLFFVLWLFGAVNTLMFLLSSELDDHDRSIIQSFRASNEKAMNLFYSATWPAVTLLVLYLVAKELFEGDY